MPCTCYAKPLAWPSESNCQVSWSHWSQWSMFSWMANMAVKRELCFPKSTGSLFACLNVHRARDACAVRHLSNYHSRHSLFQLKRWHWHLAHSRVPPRVLWSLLLRYVSMFPEPLLCETLWHGPDALSELSRRPEVHVPMVPTLLSDPQFAVPSLVRIPNSDVVHGFYSFA